MHQGDLPKHVIERLERRWASRLARGVVAWQAKSQIAHHREKLWIVRADPFP